MAQQKSAPSKLKKTVAFGLSGLAIVGIAVVSFQNFKFGIESKDDPNSPPQPTQPYGDVNGDYATNCADLELLRQIASGLAPFVETADLNSDGLANAQDVVLLRNHLLGLGLSCDSAPLSLYSVSGRVTDPNGHAIRNARVQLQNTDNGDTQIATTSSFGLFQFENIRAGSSVVITYKHDLYRCSAHQINVTENLSGIDIFCQQ